MASTHPITKLLGGEELEASLQEPFWFGLVWFGLGWCGVVWFGSVRVLLGRL
jgi:hypothetical protein